MANPTSPFSWQMPTSTDLVTDLPADFEVFGQAVATSMADLLGGTTGQVLSKTSNTDMDFTWVTTDDANAIQNSIVDAKGDLIAATANDTPARLAVGTNGHVLTADSTAATGLKWAAVAAGGKLLQVVSQAYTTVSSTTSTSFVDTGVTQNITPSSASSKVLVTVTIPYYCTSATTATAGGKFAIYRGATEIGGYSGANNVYITATSGTEVDGTWAITFLDSPATTSATTYKVRYLTRASTTTIGISTGNMASTITLMEIGA